MSYLVAVALLVFLRLGDMSPSKYTRYNVDEDASGEEGEAEVTPASGSSFSNLEPQVKPSSVEEAADLGLSSESEEDLPSGFDVIDGVVMDITNVFVQEVKKNCTEFRPYKPSRTKNPIPTKVMFIRPKQEAGWHFILFEDPLDEAGKGHLILLQKLLGFTTVKDDTDPQQYSYKYRGVERRLYQAYHVDLNDEIGGDNNLQDSAESDPDNEYANETRNSRRQFQQNLQFQRNQLNVEDGTNKADIVPVSDDIVNEDNNDENENEKEEEDDDPLLRVYRDRETVLGLDNSKHAKTLLKKFTEEKDDTTPDPFDIEPPQQKP